MLLLYQVRVQQQLCMEYRPCRAPLNMLDLGYSMESDMRFQLIVQFCTVIIFRCEVEMKSYIWMDGRKREFSLDAPCQKGLFLKRSVGQLSIIARDKSREVPDFLSKYTFGTLERWIMFAHFGTLKLSGPCPPV